MAERGESRAIYTVITDDPDFQALSPYAKLAWYTLKLRLGVSGIDVASARQVAEWTGIPDAEISAVIDELQAGRWLVVDRNVFWLRNALAFDPYVSVAHDKQRAGVLKHLKGLPKLGIVNAYADYYGIDLPFPLCAFDSLSKPLANGSAKGHERVPKQDAGERKQESGEKKEKASPSQKKSAALSEGWAPSDKHREQAALLGVDVEVEAAKMRDWATANGKKMIDWDAAFRNWLRNSKPNGTSNGQHGGNPLVGDVKELFENGGALLSTADTRPLAFAELEERFPTSWARAGPFFRQLRFQSLYAVQHNPKDLRREIEQQLDTIRKRG